MALAIRLYFEGEGIFFETPTAMTYVLFKIFFAKFALIYEFGLIKKLKRLAFMQRLGKIKLIYFYKHIHNKQHR